MRYDIGLAEEQRLSVRHDYHIVLPDDGTKPDIVEPSFFRDLAQRAVGDAFTGIQTATHRAPERRATVQARIMEADHQNPLIRSKQKNTNSRAIAHAATLSRRRHAQQTQTADGPARIRAGKIVETITARMKTSSRLTTITAPVGRSNNDDAISPAT